VRLATLAVYRRMVYVEGCAPTLVTLRKRIHSIPGGRVEFGRYYVDLDENDRVTGLRADINARIAELEKSPLLKGLI
jgi:hypothetical protein